MLLMIDSLHRCSALFPWFVREKKNRNNTQTIVRGSEITIPPLLPPTPHPLHPFHPHVAYPRPTPMWG